MGLKIKFVPFRSRLRSGKNPRRAQERWPRLDNWSSVPAIELHENVALVHRGGERVFVRRKAGA